MTGAVFAIVWLFLYGVIGTLLALRLRQDAPQFVRLTTFMSVMVFGVFGLLATLPGFRGYASFMVAMLCVTIGAYLQVKYRPAGGD